MKTFTTLAYTFFFASQIMLAQTRTLVNSSMESVSLHNIAAQFDLLSSKTNALHKNIRSVSVRNAVYVQQIGNNNNVTSNTRSIRSSINLSQRGNNNLVSLNVSAGIIDENVIQNGVNNSFFDFSSKGAFLHRAALIQNGRNQKLLWYGSNSISERLMITMKGKNQTILIRNIKR